MSLPSGSLLSELESQSSFLMRAVERGLLAAQLRAGQRDPDKLTDALFHLRHPALRGRRIRPDEPLLAAEWRALRRDVVAPALAAAGRPAAPAPSPGAAGPVERGEVGLVLQIARRPVPGMPGTTLRTLLERWRPTIAPEIPLALLLAFIRFESGGRFDDATHGSPRNGYTQPPFYELGVFQTPAGQHGTCTGPSASTCQNAPPGVELPHDPSTWVRLCRRIGADPARWQDPVTQVRVGLLDLHEAAERVRRDFRELFPTPGSDWDLRMAVLLPFARGGGFARAFLGTFRKELAALPEAQRWDFLRGKRARGARGVWTFDAKNVDEKMALAARVSGVL